MSSVRIETVTIRPTHLLTVRTAYPWPESAGMVSRGSQTLREVQGDRCEEERDEADDQQDATPRLLSNVGFCSAFRPPI